jgi:TonB family protein
MTNGSGLGKYDLVHSPSQAVAPRLLVELEPRRVLFLQNLRDLFFERRPARIRLASPPGRFWPDVFVNRRLPARPFVESYAYHFIVIASLYGLSAAWPHRVQLTSEASNKESVTYYPVSQYLPPLNTGARPAHPQKGEPAYAKQPIISVPPEADNRTQTIVTPPDIKLRNDVPLPNMVSWGQSSVPVPIAATERSKLTLPALPVSVVAPAPEVRHTNERQLPALTSSVIAPPPDFSADVRSVQGFQASVVAPPPSLDVVTVRRAGDLNIVRSNVVAPAPQLPVAEQRAVSDPARSVLAGATARATVVPPPPSVHGTGTSSVGGRIIALGIHPADVKGPIAVPQGNRRGEFAATPEGKTGASGSPNVAANHDSRGGGGENGGQSRARGAPSGIYIGAGPNSGSKAGVAGDPTQSHGTVDPALLADATTPNTSGVPHGGARPVEEGKATELEKKVFAGRRFYSMTLNMPNLNSSGGSWVIRFAELKTEDLKGDLIAPVATQKVDPAYPIELMRQNVEGTVTLHAVIRSDGTVGEVSVLQGVDDRLDEYARNALARWHFQPATKNGNAVPLEAVVRIPFRTRRAAF